MIACPHINVQLQLHAHLLTSKCSCTTADFAYLRVHRPRATTVTRTVVAHRPLCATACPWVHMPTSCAQLHFMHFLKNKYNKKVGEIKRLEKFKGKKIEKETAKKAYADVIYGKIYLNLI